MADEAVRTRHDGVVGFAHEERRSVDGAAHVESIVHQGTVFEPHEEPPGREPRDVGLIVRLGVEVVVERKARVALGELLRHRRRDRERALPLDMAMAAERCRRGLRPAELLRAPKARLGAPLAADVDGRCAKIGRGRKGHVNAVDEHSRDILSAHRGRKHHVNDRSGTRLSHGVY